MQNAHKTSGLKFKVMISKKEQTQLQLLWSQATHDKFLNLWNEYIEKNGEEPVFVGVRPELSQLHLNHLCDVAKLHFESWGKSPSQVKVLEIGSYMGESAKIFDKHFGHIVCVDPYGLKNTISDVDDMQEEEKSKDDETDVFVKTNDCNDIVYYLMANNVVANSSKMELHRMTSDDFFQNNKLEFKGYFKQTFDFVYIDGDHRYSQQRRDFENSIVVLNKNGILCGHDFSWESTQKVIEHLQLKNKKLIHFMDDSFMILNANAKES